MQKEGNKIQISQRMEQETLYSGVTNGREIELSCNSAHAQAQGYLIALFARLKGRHIAPCL